MGPTKISQNKVYWFLVLRGERYERVYLEPGTQSPIKRVWRTAGILTEAFNHQVNAIHLDANHDYRLHENGISISRLNQDHYIAIETDETDWTTKCCGRAQSGGRFCMMCGQRLRWEVA